MAFYDPMRAGPDIFGGLSDLFSQYMMFRLIQQMYPEEKGKKGEKDTLRGMPKIGEIFRDVSPVDLPPAQEIPFGGQLPMGQMGQPPMGQGQQPPGIDIQQIMQMLGGIPGLMR